MIFLGPFIIFLCFCFYSWTNLYFHSLVLHTNFKRPLSFLKYSLGHFIKLFFKKGILKRWKKMIQGFLLSLLAVGPLYFFPFDDMAGMPHFFLKEAGPYFGTFVCLFFYLFSYSILSCFFYSSKGPFSFFAFFRKVTLAFSKNTLLCLLLAPFLLSTLGASQQSSFIELSFFVTFFSFELDLMLLIRFLSMLLFFVYLLYEVPSSIFSTHRGLELEYYKENAAFGSEELLFKFAYFMRLFVLITLFLFLYSGADLFTLLGIENFFASSHLSFLIKFMILFTVLRLVSLALVRIDFVQSVLTLQGVLFSLAFLNLLLTCIIYYYYSLGGLW